MVIKGGVSRKLQYHRGEYGKIRNKTDYKMMSGYNFWNRYVFSLWQKTERAGADVMSSDRVFQILVAAPANDRSPTDTSLDEGTKRSSEVDDRRRLRDGMSATRWSSSDRYWGAMPRRAR